MGFMPSLDPPKSPLRRGVGVDFEKSLVPPFLRGARGDLALIVKQYSLTGFYLKLTLLEHCRLLSYLTVNRQLIHFRQIWVIFGGNFWTQSFDEGTLKVI